MKRLFILLCFVLSFCCSYAVKAYPGLISYVQPDSSVVNYYLIGDENYHYMVSEDGYLLSFDENDFLVYGDYNSKSGMIKPSRKKIKVSVLASQLDSIAEQKTNKFYSSHKRTSSNKGYPLVGSPKSLVILVNFEDVKFKSSSANQDFVNLLNQYNYSRNSATGSARDYFRNASNGVFEPDFIVVGPYDLPHDMKYYGEQRGDTIDIRNGNMIVDACEVADGDVDFSEYDLNNDGYIDNVFVYYAGHNQAEGGSKNSIWPHRSYILSDVRFDGVRLGDFACTSELRGSSGNFMCGIGTFVHEFGHVLSLPDLYDTQYSGHKTLGSWDVMDNGSYNNGGRTPPTYSAYERFYLGWMKPKQLLSDMNIELQPLSISNSAYLVANSEHNMDGDNPNPKEFFMVENRQNVNNDGVLATGLLITRIRYNAENWDYNVVNNNAANMGVEICCAAGSTDEPTINVFPGGRRITDFTFKLKNGTTLPKGLSQIAIGSDKNITFVYGEPSSSPTVSIENVDELGDFNALLGKFDVKNMMIVGSAISSDLNLNIIGSTFSMRLADSNDEFTSSLILKPNEDSLINASIELKYTATGYTYQNFISETLLFTTDCFEKSITLKGRTPRPVFVTTPLAREAENVSPYTFTAVWDSVYDATQYFLSVYSIVNSDTNYVVKDTIISASVDLETLKCNIRNLHEGTVYRYRVRASDRDRYGRYENITNYSNEILVTTLSGFGAESRKLDVMKMGDKYVVYLPMIDENHSIFIYSLEGHLVTSVPITDNVVEIPQLGANNIYILKYASNDGIKRKSKVIKLYYE